MGKGRRERKEGQEGKEKQGNGNESSYNRRKWTERKGIIGEMKARKGRR